MSGSKHCMAERGEGKHVMKQHHDMHKLTSIPGVKKSGEKQMATRDKQIASEYKAERKVSMGEK